MQLHDTLSCGDLLQFAIMPVSLAKFVTFVYGLIDKVYYIGTLQDRMMSHCTTLYLVTLIVEQRLHTDR